MEQRNNILYAVLFSFMMVLFVGKTVYANTTKEKTSTNATVDSILGALADMTVDKAKKIVSLRFAREYREKVCRYNKYNANVQVGFEEHNIRTLFNESCSYVQNKIEKNIISEELINAFRLDMITNGVFLIKHVKDGKELINKRIKLLEAQIKYIEEDIKLPEEYEEELLAINIINLSWLKMSAKEKIFQALSESEKYKVYVEHIKKMLDVAVEVKKVKGLVKDSIKVEVKDNGSLNLEYKIYKQSDKPSKNDLIIDRSVTLVKDVSLKNKINKKVATFLLSIANTGDKESIKYYTRELLKELLNSSCGTKCIVSINHLLDKRPKEVFTTMSKLLFENIDKSKDIDDVESYRYSFKALGTLEALSELSKVNNKETARAVLEKYQAEENTRSVRYWNHNWTLGTLFGVAGGKGECDGCVDRTLPPNLFMPFGLFYTNGWKGVQLHLFDLGQYTADQDNTTSVQSTKWEDAVAPGIALFGRLRRFPLSFGVDYTYKPNNGNRDQSESQIKLFIAMDIHLFNLN